jgi:cytochrome c oxidase subunit 3
MSTEKYNTSVFNKNHPYHLVDPSPWPALTSFSVMVLTIGLVLYFHRYANAGRVLITGLLFVIFHMFVWFRDVFRESDAGYHTPRVQSGLQLGMYLFITTEAMFFVGLLWAFFNAARMPPIQIGLQWPPVGIHPVEWYELPARNTVRLFTSYVTANAAKYGLEQNKRSFSIVNLVLTILLGVQFLRYQYEEYTHAQFTISDSVFGSNFYLTTGFHGFHVFIGVVWLTYCLVRFQTQTPQRGLCMQRSILYWHFVDVVWIFLLAGIYVWGCASPTV